MTPPLPAAVDLCVRFKDGWYCLGQVYAGACTRCGCKDQTATYTIVRSTDATKDGE